MTATLCPADAGALDAYEATAPIYDAFTAHDRHDRWTDMLESLLRPHGLPARGRLLDIGCGTGKSFAPWEARGWSVVACDASPAMLRRAAAKADPDTTTVVADARELGDLGRFDLAAMVDDVVNCLAPSQLGRAFAGAARNLAPGGLLVFDISTLSSYRTFFAATDVRDDAELFAVWRGRATEDFASGDVAEALLDGFIRDDEGAWTRIHALHRQYHHPVERITRALEEAGLRVRAVHGVDGDCDAHPSLDELRHTKAIVVARPA